MELIYVHNVSLNKDWFFKCSLEVLEVLQQVYGGALMGVQEVTPLRNFGHLTSEGQINRV